KARPDLSLTVWLHGRSSGYWRWRHEPERASGARFRSRERDSVPEVAHAGKYHGHAVFIGGGNDLVVAHGTARLDHRRDAGSYGGIDAVAEREECVRGHHRTAHLETGMFGLDGGDARRIDAAHLAGAHADG